MTRMTETRFLKIEELFIRYLEDEAEKINADFTYVRCRAYAKYPTSINPQGTQSVDYLNMFMDCLLTEASLEKTDNLALEIEVSEMDNSLSINADICWGYPYGKTEEAIFDGPVEATERNLAIVQERLPSLVSRLRKLIRDNPQGI